MVISPKTNAVIIAEPIADFCAVVTCCVLFGLKVKQLLKGTKKTIEKPIAESP